MLSLKSIEVQEKEISNFYSEIERSKLKEMRNNFHKYGYLKFPNYTFLPKSTLEKVNREVVSLLAHYSIRRDIVVESTSNSPRKMYNVNQPEIKDEGNIIPLLYNSQALKSFLGFIANDELVSCWEQEQFLITKLQHTGDTHGWHWGDYPYTVIWIIEAPEDPALGGLLQCIPHTEWDKSSPDIWNYILSNEIRFYHHLKGDVYFLKSDTTLHRVTPLTENTVRIILNTCWASKFDHRDSVEHESIDAIWGTRVRI